MPSHHGRRRPFLRLRPRATPFSQTFLPRVSHFPPPLLSILSNPPNRKILHRSPPFLPPPTNFSPLPPTHSCCARPPFSASPPVLPTLLCLSPAASSDPDIPGHQEERHLVEGHGEAQETLGVGEVQGLFECRLSWNLGEVGEGPCPVAEVTVDGSPPGRLRLDGKPKLTWEMACRAVVRSSRGWLPAPPLRLRFLRFLFPLPPFPLPLPPFPLPLLKSTCASTSPMSFPFPSPSSNQLLPSFSPSRLPTLLTRRPTLSLSLTCRSPR